MHFLSFFILRAKYVGAVHVPEVSVRWPDGGEERPNMDPLK